MQRHHSVLVLDDVLRCSQRLAVLFCNCDARVSLPQRLAPFTHEAQAWIWERQNPPPSHCSSAGYLLGFVGMDQGLGSAMHTATVHLAVAMQHNRIFLWAPDTSKTPIAEERMWWRETVDAHHRPMNDNVRHA